MSKENEPLNNENIEEVTEETSIENIVSEDHDKEEVEEKKEEVVSIKTDESPEGHASTDGINEPDEKSEATTVEQKTKNTTAAKAKIKATFAKITKQTAIAALVFFLLGGLTTALISNGRHSAGKGRDMASKNVGDLGGRENRGSNNNSSRGGFKNDSQDGNGKGTRENQTDNQKKNNSGKDTDSSQPDGDALN